MCQFEALDSFCTMLDTTVLDFTVLDSFCTIPDRVAKSPKSQTRKIWARPGVVKLSTQKLFPSLELCLAPLLVSFLSLPLQNNLLLNDQIWTDLAQISKMTLFEQIWINWPNLIQIIFESNIETEQTWHKYLERADLTQIFIYTCCWWAGNIT